MFFYFHIPLTNAQSIDDLVFYTEDYPPYNFNEDGKIKGISIDLLVEIFKLTGSQLGRNNITLIPWARSYQYVIKKKNTVLFSMTRTTERENLFHWVGPIAPSNMVLIAKRSRKINIDSVDDIKKYKLGAIRDDIGEHLLRKIIGPEQKIFLTNHGVNSAKQLNSGRIHLWSYEENVAFWFIKKAGFNPNDFEIAYVIEKGSEWYALNKDTNPFIVKEMQKALDQVGETNRNKIIDKYLR